VIAAGRLKEDPVGLTRTILVLMLLNCVRW